MSVSTRSFVAAVLATGVAAGLAGEWHGASRATTSQQYAAARAEKQIEQIKLVGAQRAAAAEEVQRTRDSNKGLAMCITNLAAKDGRSMAITVTDYQHLGDALLTQNGKVVAHIYHGEAAKPNWPAPGEVWDSIPPTPTVEPYDTYYQMCVSSRGVIISGSPALAAQP